MRIYGYDGTTFSGRDIGGGRVESYRGADGSYPGDTNVPAPLPITDPLDVVSRLTAPIPERGLYEAVLDTRATPPYETLVRIDLAFSGTPQSADGRVTETRIFEPVTLDQLYEDKSQELRDYGERVYFSAFEHTVSTLSFWVPSTQIALHSRHSYNGFLTTRIADILTDSVQAGIDDGGGTNAEVAAFWNAIKATQTGPVPDQYWTRDIKVFLYDQVTLAQVRDTANQNQWSGLMASQATFGWQVRNADARVADDIDAAYADGAGDFATLAAIDVADASYNWPPYYDGDLSARNGTITVQQMRTR